MDIICRRINLLWLILILVVCSCDKSVSVTGVSVEPHSLSMTIGDTDLLVAHVTPDNATTPWVSWSSTKPGVVKVDESGFVYALAVGEAKVIATTEDGGFMASCSVSVKPIEVSSVYLSTYYLGLKKGESRQISATVSPSDATEQDIHWFSADENIATVSADGTVTAVRGGTTSVTASAGDHTSEECIVNVTADLESLSVNPSELNLKKGESASLAAIIEPSDATGVYLYWTSDDWNVARVSDEGVVTAIGGGTTTIKAHINDFEAACTVNVTVPVTWVSVYDTWEIEAGRSRKLDITIYPEDATDKTVIWASSNPEIAYVSNDGILYGVSMGTTTIGYRTAEIPSYFVQVTVLSHAETPEAVDLGLSSYWGSFNLGATKPEEYGYYYAWGETEPKIQYNVDTYKHVMHADHYVSSMMLSLIKYNKDILMGYNGFTDWKATLDNTDDAAFVKLGPNWHIPTITDIYELYTQCSWTFTSRNGVNGLLVTGPNGNSIFLPCAGYKSGSSLGLAGRDGFYWGNQYDSSFCCDATTIWFSRELGHPGFFQYYYYQRDKGHSIRPVANKSASSGGIRDEVKGSYTVREYISYDFVTWKQYRTYEMTISPKNPYSDVVGVTNLFNGDKTISGTLDTRSGDITLDPVPVIYYHERYGDIHAYLYDAEKDDIVDNPITLKYSSSERKYKSDPFLAKVEAGYLGLYYVEMEHK